MADALLFTTALNEIVLRLDSDGRRFFTGEALAAARFYFQGTSEHATTWFETRSCGVEFKTRIDRHETPAEGARERAHDASRSYGSCWLVDDRLVVSVSAVQSVFDSLWPILQIHLGRNDLELQIGLHLEEKDSGAAVQSLLERGQWVSGYCSLTLGSKAPEVPDEDDD